MIIWHSNTPSDDVMLALSLEWPQQHDYFVTNKLYYLVTIIAYAASCAFAVHAVTAGLATCALAIWEIFVMFWNATKYEEVYDTMWLLDTRYADI
jgi:hypothetical protein